MEPKTIAPMLRIDVYSHFIKLTGYNDWVKGALLQYCRGLAQFGLVRKGPGVVIREMLRVFVATTKDRREFRFHRNQYEDLMRHLARYGCRPETIHEVVHDLHTPAKFMLRWHSDKLPRENQPMFIEYGLKEPTPGYAPSKLIALQTGKGKGMISMCITRDLGVRAVMVVKAGYVPKWIPEVKEYFKIRDSSDLITVRGSDALLSLIERAKQGKLTASFIIISSKTLYNFVEEYENNGVSEATGGICPDELYPLLKAGVRIIDEVHQEFHFNYRQDLYTHVPLTLSMSATLDSDDGFINGMFRIVWPGPTRPPEVPHDAFIAVKALWYTLNQPHRLRWLNPMKQYSHTKFEQSLMRHTHMLQNYLNMISSIVQTSYAEVREPGQKMMIFCGTVEMCTQVVTQLRAGYKDLVVNRYVQEDPYENLLSADIVVSTIQSAGTAVDVPNLRITLMTVALNSKQSNLQVLGRTRKLKDWPDVTPEFLFLSAREIDKHRQYSQAKEEKFRGKVKSFKDLQTPYRI